MRGLVSNVFLIIDYTYLQIIFQSTTDIPRIRFETLAGATFTKHNITAWFSNYGYHDSAISLSLVNNAILRALSPGSSLKFVNHPLPYSLENWVSFLVTSLRLKAKHAIY